MSKHEFKENLAIVLRHHFGDRERNPETDEDWILRVLYDDEYRKAMCREIIDKDPDIQNLPYNAADHLPYLMLIELALLFASRRVDAVGSLFSSLRYLRTPVQNKLLADRAAVQDQ